MELAIETGRFVARSEALTVDIRKAASREQDNELGFSLGSDEQGLEVNFGEEDQFKASLFRPQVCPPCAVSESGLAASVFHGHALLSAAAYGTVRSIVFCSCRPLLCH